MAFCTCGAETHVFVLIIQNTHNSVPKLNTYPFFRVDIAADVAYPFAHKCHWLCKVDKVAVVVVQVDNRTCLRVVFGQHKVT